MENAQSGFQNYPFKVYIQDIFRAKRNEKNKYFYELFGLTFKNIMIHGVVTSLYNKTNTFTNIELSDPTGTVQIYYDWTKKNKKVSKDMMESLHRDFIKEMRFENDKIDIYSKMMAAISEKNQNSIDFEEGSYISVTGDIFIDDLKGTRMVSAYECNATSVERDIVWMEELRYLYQTCYLSSK